MTAFDGTSIPAIQITEDRVREIVREELAAALSNRAEADRNTGADQDQVASTRMVQLDNTDLSGLLDCIERVLNLDGIDIVNRYRLARVVQRVLNHDSSPSFGADTASVGERPGSVPLAADPGHPDSPLPDWTPGVEGDAAPAGTPTGRGRTQAGAGAS